MNLCLDLSSVERERALRAWLVYHAWIVRDRPRSFGWPIHTVTV
jgi:hypothetical protein